MNLKDGSFDINRILTRSLPQWFIFDKSALNLFLITLYYQLVFIIYQQIQILMQESEIVHSVGKSILTVLILGAFEAKLEAFILANPSLKKVERINSQCLFANIQAHDIYIALCGVGTMRAACTTTALYEALHPNIILMCGTAGSVVAGQNIGDLIIAEREKNCDAYLLTEIYWHAI